MSQKFISELKRSHHCGDLNASHDGAHVVLMGWVDTRRDHGGLIFVDLRDRSGLVQVVLNPKDEACRVAPELRNEFVIAIQGKVRLRPEGMKNENLKSGEIEVEAQRCEVLSSAKTPPFQFDDEKVSEVLRLKYRYLDLRSARLQGHLIKRHETAMVARNALDKLGFLEVETPILYKSTPEGARDYLVPSRVHPGHFFALPQSPQTLKQLLMISGVDRYFQMARCFRDEDLRADRQPEFSQIDMEMSFVDMDDVMATNESLLKEIWKKMRGKDIGVLPRMTYQEVMEKYGSDKPDLRIPWEIKDIGKIASGCGFKVFDDVVGRGDVVKALAISGIGNYSRGQFDKLTNFAKQMKAKGLVWIKSDGGKLVTPVAKFFAEDKLQEIFTTAGGKEGDAVLIVADQFEVSCSALGHLRNHLAHELDVIDHEHDEFLWVTDFPLLAYDPEEKRYAAMHHPFTQPMDEDLEILTSGDETNFHKIRAKAYDLVCNGYELGGGSVRIHRHDVQSAMFKALGLTEEEVEHKFGFFIEALSYGTPPHGGFAWGLDRLVMILCRTEAIRDVIAFPKTTKAQDLMSSAPNTVAREQLVELGVKLSASAEKNILDTEGTV